MSLPTGSRSNCIVICFRSSFRTLDRGPCYRINEPISLTIQFTEPQFEMNSFSIRFS
jgi:hypothetical protein